MSIKANKMALAAGVSALALMVMSSVVMAQETTVDVGLEQPELVIDPVVTEPTPSEIDQQPTEIGFEYEVGQVSEPEVVIDPVSEVITIDDGDMGTTDEPVVVDGDEGTGDALLDIVPLDGPADATDDGEVATDVEPTGLHMLDDGTVVDVAVVEKTAGVELQNSAPALVKAAESAQDRVARASAVPNLCDTAAGQNNKFFCGSYKK